MLTSKARPEEIGVEVFPGAPIPRRLYRLLKRPPYQRGGENAPRGIQGNGLPAVSPLHAIGACLRELWAKGAYPLERRSSRGARGSRVNHHAAGYGIRAAGLFASLATAVLADTLDEHYYALAFREEVAKPVMHACNTRCDSGYLGVPRWAAL